MTFVEITAPVQVSRPRTRTAYAILVEPKSCSELVKRLSRELPLPAALSHLKRVRKPPSTPLDGSNEPAQKRPKLSELEVLIGENRSAEIEEKYGSLHAVTVPGRPAESQAEAKEFNKLWPCQFFPLKSEEHRAQELALQQDELEFMKKTMEFAVEKKVVVVVDPGERKIVSQSDHEHKLQGEAISNPLATPILLALQGVSRLERHAAENMTSENFSKGQYLCTGYDLYTPYEPTVFEAMACAHSRLRRLVFHNGHTRFGAVWRDGCTKHFVHCLPGTNHHYRAFQYVESSTTD